MLLKHTDSTDLQGLLGKTDYELSPTPLADKYRDGDNRVLAGIPMINEEELVTGKDHLIYRRITTKLPIHNESGAIIGTLGISRPKVRLVDEELEPPVQAVLAYIRDHYREAPSNSLLALLVHKSEEELDQLFYKHLKITPKDYLRRVRVGNACHDLVNAKLTLEEVATAHGFESLDQLTQEFQAEMGITPVQHRWKLFERKAVKR